MEYAQLENKSKNKMLKKCFWHCKVKLKRIIKTKTFFLLLFVKLFLIFYFYLNVINDQKRLDYLERFQQSLHFKYPTQDSTNWTMDEWKFLGAPELRYQLYSAYFDTRVEVFCDANEGTDCFPFGVIRIISVLPLEMNKQKMSCHYKYTNKVEIVSSSSVQAIRENFGFVFSAFFIICPLSASINTTSVELPEAVAVTYEKEKTMREVHTFIKIRYPTNNETLDSEDKLLAICVPPAHHNYSEALRIVEFVEIYKILGANKFYFYNRSISTGVNDVMDYYESINEATILQWNLNGYAFEKELRYEGIFAALNDCLYRASFVDGYKYVAVVDFDEILIPMNQLTLTDFLNDYYDDDVYMYNFRSVLLYNDTQNGDEIVPAGVSNKYLYSQMEIKRTEPLPYSQRTKYIARGANCIELGNHFVWDALSDTKQYKVTPLNGLVYHYRDEMIRDVPSSRIIVDRSVQIYGESLWPAVDTTCLKIFLNGVCPIK